MSDSPQPNRRPLIVANWKMNKTGAETEEFIKGFLPNVPKDLDRDVAICPPFPWLSIAQKLLAGSSVALGSQDVSEHESGAYTSEVSAPMLKAAGCTFAIIGHSERRQYHNETDAIVRNKIVATLKEGLIPIVCIGEKLEEREANKTLDVVSKQVTGALEDLPSTETKKLVLAYEPVWAIGTGKTATPAQAQEVHRAIRDLLKEQYGSQVSHVVRILYGGSVKPDNMSELMACEDIDGGLVGGASLKPDSFQKLVQFQAQSVASK